MHITDLKETSVTIYKESAAYPKKKAKYDLRSIWNGIFYLVKTGCQ